jgi:predicted DNA-binding transcriptional regulator AlpA
MDTPREVLRPAQAWALMGIGRSSFYDRVKRAVLPPPFSLGGNVSGVFAHEIHAVLRAYAAGADEEDVRRLVVKLVAARQGGHDARRR